MNENATRKWLECTASDKRSKMKRTYLLLGKGSLLLIDSSTVWNKTKLVRQSKMTINDSSFTHVGIHSRSSRPRQLNQHREKETGRRSKSQIEDFVAGDKAYVYKIPSFGQFVRYWSINELNHFKFESATPEKRPRRKTTTP